MVLYLRQPGGWQLAGTSANPFKVRLPGGGWREYGAGSGRPLYLKMPDGTWKVVTREGKGGFWYIAPGGAPGSDVSVIPPIAGPYLYSAPGEPPAAHVSSDPIPALEYTQQGQQNYWYGEGTADDYGMDLGTANGFSMFIVFQMGVPAAPSNGFFNDPAVFVGAFGTENDSGIDVGIRNWYSGSSTSLGVDVWWEEDSGFLGYDTGSYMMLTNDSRQLFEVRFVAETQTWSLRLDGTDYEHTYYGFSPGVVIPPIPIRAPAILGRAGATPTKIWEVKLVPKGLIGAELASERSYFASRYGIAV